MKMSKRTCILLVSVLLFSPLAPRVFAENAVIAIDPDKEIGTVNKKVFGNNLIDYQPASYEDWTKGYYGYSDYGAGIWDPRLKRSVKEVIDLAKLSGMTVARFPGGCGTHTYNWKDTIVAGRKHFLYGLDEFLETCEEIGAEPVITLSYFTGDEFDAQELVEYLNAPSGEGHKWADLRASKGRSLPYHVKYFEIGNEIYHGDHRKIKKVLPQDYARRYLKYYAKMKTVDPSLKIGVVLDNNDLNREVLEIIKDNADFGIIHIYPRPNGSKDRIDGMNPKDIFRETLGPAVLKEEAKFSDVLKSLRENAGKDIPLAITEYNAGFWEDRPLPYRHCLGTALLNAELLRVFMKPEFDILMANYWLFLNEYWRMAANGFGDRYEDMSRPYYKRPNFYVFQLYHEHFGDILVDTKVNSASLSVNVSKSKDGKTLYLMVVNKNMDNGVPASIHVGDFKAARAQAWVLNGPRVESLNEKDHQEVYVKQVNFDLDEQKNDDKVGFTFEPHSLTAIEIALD